MALSSIGTQNTQAVLFNTGYLTINGTNYVFDIKDLSMDQKVSVKDYHSLNSIFKKALRRTDYELSMKFTVVSNPIALQQAFYSSSSSDGSGDTIFIPLDGQQSALNLTITAYFDAAKTQGYQFTANNCVIASMNTKLALDDFASVDFEVMATQITNTRIVGQAN